MTFRSFVFRITAIGAFISLLAYDAIFRWSTYEFSRSLRNYILKADERFREERNRAYISKWLKKSINLYESLDASLEGLKLFFRDVGV